MNGDVITQSTVPLLARIMSESGTSRAGLQREGVPTHSSAAVES